MASFLLVLTPHANTAESALAVGILSRHTRVLHGTAYAPSEKCRAPHVEAKLPTRRRGAAGKRVVAMRKTKRKTNSLHGHKFAISTTVHRQRKPSSLM